MLIAQTVFGGNKLHQERHVGDSIRLPQSGAAVSMPLLTELERFARGGFLYTWCSYGAGFAEPYSTENSEEPAPAAAVSLCRGGRLSCVALAGSLRYARSCAARAATIAKRIAIPVESLPRQPTTVPF